MVTHILPGFIIPAVDSLSSLDWGGHPIQLPKTMYYVFQRTVNQQTLCLIILFNNRIKGIHDFSRFLPIKAFLAWLKG
jgi:hypothetical protein